MKKILNKKLNFFRRNIQKKIENNIISFFVNGKKHEIKNPNPTTTLLTYLRNEGLKGTKLGCGEGGKFYNK
jgi:xanthine dehydrogenase iron-sulfur cluster and FAD-binding subunit A